MTIENQKRNEIKTLSDDSVFYFLYKKIEKISLAIYLVSDFFDLRESLKWDLRSTVNNIHGFSQLASPSQLRAFVFRNNVLTV